MAEDIKKNSLADAIDKFVSEAEFANTVRKELITQLREDVKKMRVSEFDKAMVISAKMSINTTLLSALKDCEDSASKRVKMELSRTEQENESNCSAAVVQLLQMIRADEANGGTQNVPKRQEEEVQDAIEKRGKELGVTITEGELEGCGDIPKGTAPKSKENEPSKE